jgi:serine/threonine protein kinase/ABC-type phosphate/phosphonate transport system substrate-binding protein
MDELQKCPKCGAPIPADARWGMCPRCLLDPNAQLPQETAGTSNASFGEPGRRFGDYEMVRQIGRGGMGAVYEAIQLRAHRRVAVKMILDTHAASPAARRRFAIEAEAAAKLDHPNIVPIYEVGEHDEQPFLSMKLVEGQSLRDKLTSGELCVAGRNGDKNKTVLRDRETAVARLMATVARAVQHAHQKHVLHRDLKPGNILLDGDGQPHLTDFGLAKILDETDVEGTPAQLSRSSALLGTPSYMSPEQASNQRLTTASDIYSLGAMFYEMLTGQPPFKGNSLLETIRMVTEQEPKRPRAIVREISPDLETICLKCLEKNPAARYSSALVLAEDLERWLRQEPIRARRSGPVLRTRRWVSRNPVGAGLIVSLCACLTVSLMFLRAAWETEERNRIIGINSLTEFTAEVDRLWENPNRTDVHIPSSQLAALAGRPPREFLPNAERLTLARTIADAPVVQAMQTEPLLAALSEEMEKRLQRQVRIDLRLSKDRSWADPPVSRGDADVQYISALTYVRLKKKSPGLQPIVLWGPETVEAVLFARGDSGITNVGQVAGHRAIFAHANSIVSFMGKVLLVREGICARDLDACHILDRSIQRPAPVTKDDPAVAQEGETDSEDFAHREVIEKVLSGEFDVGMAPRRRFDQNKHKGRKLVELKSFQVPRNVMVARAGLEAKVLEAFRQCLTSTKSGRKIAVEGRLRRVADQGFTPAADSDFDYLRANITNELARFENSRPASPSTNAAALPAR